MRVSGKRSHDRKEISGSRQNVQDSLNKLDQIMVDFGKKDGAGGCVYISRHPF
jgi:hypothetical protein